MEEQKSYGRFDTTKQATVYSKQHIQFACEALISSHNLPRLECFLWALPKEYDDMEIILIAKSFLAFRNKEFQTLYDLLQNTVYSPKYHHQLQSLWRTAHYIEAENLSGRVLGAVGKYRIRKKYPFPRTIWNGENISYCFQEEARQILNNAYMKDPYPTADEKLILAKAANLTVAQVGNWFKNKRQRARATGNKQTYLSKEQGKRRNEQETSAENTNRTIVSMLHTKQIPELRTYNTYRQVIHRPHAVKPYCTTSPTCYRGDHLMLWRIQANANEVNNKRQLIKSDFSPLYLPYHIKRYAASCNCHTNQH